jgi:integrase
VQSFRVQRGYIYQLNGAWHVRYRVAGKQKSERLAPFCDQYRTLKSVRHLAEAILHPINQGQQPTGAQTVQDFVERTYLPYVLAHKRPSTYRGYLNLYSAQISSRVAGIKIAPFRTVDAQRLLDRIAAETSLSHRSHIHIKALLSGIFAHAKRTGVIDVNPIVGTEIPRGHSDGSTHAYSLSEIKSITGKLEGTARAAVIVAAWTGLSLAELRGLQWQDIGDNEIIVRRTYWHQHESPPKTKARGGTAVPLLPEVIEALKEHLKRTPGTKFVFEGPRQTPIDLATLGSKVIKTALKGSGVEWFGWHALRRGFATNLHEAGVQDKIIQSLLRHSSLAVTMAHYVKPAPQENVKAMQKLNASRRGGKKQ